MAWEYSTCIHTCYIFICMQMLVKFFIWLSYKLRENNTNGTLLFWFIFANLRSQPYPEIDWQKCTHSPLIHSALRGESWLVNRLIDWLGCLLSWLIEGQFVAVVPHGGIYPAANQCFISGKVKACFSPLKSYIKCGQDVVYSSPNSAQAFEKRQHAWLSKNCATEANVVPYGGLPGEVCLIWWSNAVRIANFSDNLQGPIL